MLWLRGSNIATRREPIRQLAESLAKPIVRQRRGREVWRCVATRCNRAAAKASKKQFEYYFSDASKAGMKEKFQDIFKDATKAEKLWKANPEFFMSLDDNITKFEHVVQLAKDGKLKDLINWVK